MPAPTPDFYRHIKRLEVVSKHLVQEALAGDYKSAFHGMGLEFEEVREYQPGDEVRAIDWNVTARQGRPFVKVFREERERTVLFCVDVSASQAFGSRGSAKRELAARLLAALGFAAAAGGDKIGLVLHTDRVELALPPRKGRARVMRAVRETLALRPKGRGTAFAPVARRLPSLARRGSVVFWISDLRGADLDAALRQARARYDNIACRLVDPAEDKLPAGLGVVPCRDPETGEGYWLDTNSAAARRAWDEAAARWAEGLRKRMVALRIDKLDLATDCDLGRTLLHFFRMRERRSR